MKKVKRWGYYWFDKPNGIIGSYRALGIRNEWIIERARQEAAQARRERG